MKRFALAAAALMATTAMPASAATIVGLYNTGVNNAGVATTGNGVDLHWTLGGGTAYTGATNGVFPIGPWVAETSDSRWLTSTPNASDDTSQGFYTYSTAFDLTGFNPSTASFTGRYAVDDTVTSILLNGVEIGTGSLGGGFTSFTNFASGSGNFVIGRNTISFVTQNGGGPSGFRAEFTSSNVNAVPEPATWAMMMLGFGMVGFGLRARRSGKVTTKVAFV